MKWVSLQPTEGSYNFSQAKAMVNAARNNDMLVRGHVLVWFDQTPEWVFAGSKEQVLTRMRTHITRVMQEFAGSVYAWDVVNEAVVPFDVNNQDVGEDLAALDHWGYRDSQWYQKTGEDFIFEAFAAARAADCRRHTWGAARVWFVSACFLSACFVCACFLSACFVTACTSGSIDPLGPSTALALLPSPSSHVVDPFWLWPPTTSGGQTSDTSPDRPRHPLAPTNKRPRVKRESQEECERRLYRECPDCMGPACL